MAPNWIKVLMVISCICLGNCEPARQLRGNAPAGQRRQFDAGRRFAFRRRKQQSIDERHEDDKEREERSLLNTFPFNSQGDATLSVEGFNDNDVHHHDHHAGHDVGPQARAFPVQQDRFALSFGDPSAFTTDPSVGRLSLGQRYEDNAPLNKQGVSFAEVAEASPGNDGKRCIDKVEMVVETEYDDIVKCDHSYDKRCHTTYVTTYESTQEEECDDNFRKSCFIEYEKVAFNQSAKVCRTPLVKDCNVQGPEICSTQGSLKMFNLMYIFLMPYESECWTKNEEHEVEDDVVDCETVKEEKCENLVSGYTSENQCSTWPKEVCRVTKKRVLKFTPITACTKEPREICAPAGCGFKEGAEECFDKVQTVIQDSPKEQCSLEPQRTCQHITKLVPKLEPTEECVDVPKEICTRSKTNPRKVRKPVVKKWCYVPSAESGLAK